METQTQPKMKTCYETGKTLPLTTEYWHRNKASKDGFLGRCKEAQMKHVTKYNKENPDYFKNWNEVNKEHVAEYNKQNHSANTNCKIYGIVNMLGEVYVGMTKLNKIEKRFAQHKSYYDNNKGALPRLHSSFAGHGPQWHAVFLIEELDTDDKKEGLKREHNWIECYMKQNKSLNYRP